MRPAVHFVALALAGVLAGCATQNYSGLLIPVAETDGTRKIEVLVAASRIRGDDPYSFTFGRSTLVNYQSVLLSVPPSHRRGEIELPRRGPPDPAIEFAALDNKSLTDAEFARKVVEHAVRGDGNVHVFIHGFNTTYEEAVFRTGQIIGDSNLTGASMLFTWPSRGRVLDYLTDRESATFSRDRLELVLRHLAAQPQVKRINLLAHSMGAFLTMETLRQAKLKGDGEFRGKLNSVGLAAPDIDLDVFRSQLEVIGKRHRPTLILISSDDQALSWSRFLSGDVERVGIANVNSPEARAEIERFGLIFVDASAVQGNDGYNHGKFAGLSTTIQAIAGLTPGQSREVRQGVILTLNRDGAIVPMPDRDGGR
jgi:esterase/lipase superfamily enzyme